MLFGDSYRDGFAWRASRMPDVSAFCAASGGRIVSFKVDYAAAERKYFSWLGGVHPDFAAAASPRS